MQPLYLLDDEHHVANTALRWNFHSITLLTSENIDLYVMETRNWLRADDFYRNKTYSECRFSSASCSLSRGISPASLSNVWNCPRTSDAVLPYIRYRKEKSNGKKNKKRATSVSLPTRCMWRPAIMYNIGFGQEYCNVIAKPLSISKYQRVRQPETEKYTASGTAQVL